MTKTIKLGDIATFTDEVESNVHLKPLWFLNGNPVAIFYLADYIDQAGVDVESVTGIIGQFSDDKATEPFETYVFTDNNVNADTVLYLVRDKDTAPIAPKSKLEVLMDMLRVSTPKIEHETKKLGDIAEVTDRCMFKPGYAALPSDALPMLLIDNIETIDKLGIDPYAVRLAVAEIDGDQEHSTVGDAKAFWIGTEGHLTPETILTRLR